MQCFRQNLARLPDDLLRALEYVGRTDSQQTNLLRRHGIYAQRPVEDGFLMVRIRIPEGELTAARLRALASLCNEHGRGLADITVRQNIQLHWVRPQGIGELFETLSSVGLSTIEPGGGALRNIVTCPVSGLDEDELYDTTGLVRSLTRLFESPSIVERFTEMPRKLKICISGCAVRCGYPEVNDIGIFAVPDFEKGGVAFRARVGGGLSVKPRFSQDLGVLVRSDEVLGLIWAIVNVFRAREKRETDKRSRTSYLVESCEMDRFRAEVEERFARPLRRGQLEQTGTLMERDRSHLGIHGQRRPGFYYLGLSLVGGRTSGDALERLADLAEQYGSGRVRTTNTQNLILVDIPEWNLEKVTGELERSGFDYQPSWSRRGLIACTGLQFCNLAMTETKNRAEQLADSLETEVELDEPVRISVTGCANACGQHHICDVGLEGSLSTIDGVKQETFQVMLGGGVGAHESFSRRIGLHVPAENVTEAITRLFAFYKAKRAAEETFQEFCRRHSDEELIAHLKPSFNDDLPESTSCRIDSNSKSQGAAGPMNLIPLQASPCN